MTTRTFAASVACAQAHLTAAYEASGWVQTRAQIEHALQPTVQLFLSPTPPLHALAVELCKAAAQAQTALDSFSGDEPASTPAPDRSR